jgi:excisionase family DNA binding protein
MMTELLTTRQVQNLLKVDRITIYRMLQDGRLKGVKIGQQWRFQVNEVERLLNGEAPAESPAPISLSQAPLPVHCLQTVQNLFTGVSQVGGLIVDPSGEPVTTLSGACQLCRMMQSTPSGAQACRDSWKSMVAATANGEREFTCHAGLNYLAAPVMDGETLVGWLLAGQIRLADPIPEENSDRMQDLARTHALPVSAVQEAFRQAPLIPSEKHALLHTWVTSAATAMESIMQERSGFMQRLQQIANLTQLV